jgi:hypothetical protein
MAAVKVPVAPSACGCYRRYKASFDFNSMPAAGDYGNLNADSAVQGKSELSRKPLKQCKKAWSDTILMVLSVCIYCTFPT